MGVALLHARNRVTFPLLSLTTLLTLVLSGALPAETDFRCVVCKLKVSEGFNVEGKFYCKAHVETVQPHCGNCGAAITGTYRMAGPKEVPVCQDCQRNYAKCFLCNVPADVARGGIYLKDGRQLCAEHNKIGVRSESTARRLFRQGIQETVNTLGTIMRLDVPINNVYLVDLDRLRAISAQGSHGSSLASGKVLGLTSLQIQIKGGQTSTLPATVHLLNWVDEERMLTVSVHEYSHAWQAENHQQYNKTNQELREGFAEWVAYKVCENYQRYDQMKILTSPRGGVYYNGLMKFLALEQDRGVKGVLEYATTAQSI